MTETSTIPVVDLFAGPGGLGEGFSAFSAAKGSPAFHIALSIEMEEWAHQTLLLRSFFRHFPPASTPDEYYAHLRGEITRSELFDSFPEAAEAARRQAWRAELGVVSPAEVDRRILSALKSADQWVLCGGPPCQAFSVVGRARNGGISDDDHRVYLYRQYLRILAIHQPPVFIMENVKGLLSSQVKGSEIFEQMLQDLRQPAKAARTRSAGCARYALFSLVKSGERYNDSHYDNGNFVVRSEDYGIPQRRHRVIILGVRDDLVSGTMPTLEPHSRSVSAGKVLGGLPPLRSGLSRQEDRKDLWRVAVEEILDSDFMHSRRNGSHALIRNRILTALCNVRDYRADRGGEFVACDPSIAYEPGWFLDPRIGGACNHASRRHMAADLHRYLFAACYARIQRRSPELSDFPADLHPHHRNLKKALSVGHFDDRFRVQLADHPATTVTSHIAKDGHYFIHYDESQCRSLTVREAARLQTFPDNYYFCGPRTHQFRQVGNAVPPLLALQIAGLVARILKGAEGSSASAQLRRVAQYG